MRYLKVLSSFRRLNGWVLRCFLSHLYLYFNQEARHELKGSLSLFLSAKKNFLKK